MQPGEVVADRFELERVAGEGGMGAVWRARDRTTGAVVALKLMLQHNHDSERFAREAEVLSRLRHDAIVRHIAHGTTHHGLMYLAMEWIDGPDLAARIAQGPISVAQTLALGARIAAALEDAHARGVLHRDVKPPNIVLAGGKLEDVKLIDFGIARAGVATSTLTRTGAAIGTIGYMAPEQARGAREIDARADVFSLGCVLFECLTGVHAFVGEHWVAVLAKVLLYEPPRLRDLLADAPPALDELIARMLSKEPGARPRDGGEVHAALRQLASALERVATTSSFGLSVAPPTATPASLSRTELGIASLVLMDRPDLARAATLTPQQAAHDHERLRAEARRRSGELEVLADGSILAFFAGDGLASDLAARAVRCAVALRSLLPDRAAVVATGRAAIGQRLPFGEVVDTAARMLGARALGIQLDEVTRSLVGTRFEIQDGVLTGERAEGGGPRAVLGRSVPFLGRARELAVLGGSFDECAGDSVARAAIVVATAGAGKSRLVGELLRELRARRPDARVWTGYGDPTTTGSSLSILRDALRRGGAGSRALLQASIDGATAEVRAARGDSRAVSEQMRRAFEECVVEACREGPLVLVLEDLHWGDGASVDFVDSTLKAAANEPFMVIATGRPELAVRFPKLWDEALAMRVALPPLARRATESLARAMLPDCAGDVIARLAQQSEGNALFLEELARAEAEGRARELPGSVIAMVHARIERLSPKARLVLRAASVFGRTFWRGGVGALVGEEMDAREVDRCLEEITERELASESDDRRLPDDRQYLFHHELTREAAYRTLTEEDRALGHKLAGDWLEGAGETDSLVLAAHFEKGRELTRAIAAYYAAAAHSLEAGDFAAALDVAEKGIVCGASGEVRGMLRLVQAEAHWWRDTDARAALASAALDLTPRTASWARALMRLAMLESRANNVDALARMSSDLAVAVAPLLDPFWAGALLMIAVQLLESAPESAATLAASAIELASHPAAARSAPDALGSLAEGDLETLIRLGWAEALEEKGDRAAARAAIGASRERVLERAAKMRDAAAREHFLATAENVRTFELARAWGLG